MTVNKPVILIAGMPEDRVFGHVCYIASNLSEMLPNFTFEKICKKRGEWEPWLQKFCKAHDWSHTKSPLVWREIGMRGGKATYVGGASQFWEYVYEYYGIDSRLTKDELKALKLDAMRTKPSVSTEEPISEYDVTKKEELPEEYEVEASIAAAKAKMRHRRVTIIGAGRSLCEDLVAELVMIDNLHSANGIVVRLYDEAAYILKVKECVKDTSAVGGGRCAATIVKTVCDGLVNCDILILLDELLREETDGTDEWLNRNRTSMLGLAAQINEFAPAHMRVIFCSMGATCFNAGVLAMAATKLNKNNIVVVSAHYGLELLYGLLNAVDVPLKEVGCPPVWGFLGVNHFIDVCNMVQKHEVYRPNNRALKPHEGTTLPLGVKHVELRSFFYMAHDKNPFEYLYERRAKLNYQVGRTGDFQKCKAICDLLRLWYDDKNNTDGEIISLGICSDGSFGIPEGVFFSQPVYLKELKDESRIWVPCLGFPEPNHPGWIFRNLIACAEYGVRRFIRLYVPPYLPETVDCCCKSPDSPVN